VDGHLRQPEVAVALSFERFAMVEDLDGRYVAGLEDDAVFSNAELTLSANVPYTGVQVGACCCVLIGRIGHGCLYTSIGFERALGPCQAGTVHRRRAVFVVADRARPADFRRAGRIAGNDGGSVGAYR